LREYAVSVKEVRKLEPDEEIYRQTVKCLSDSQETYKSDIRISQILSLLNSTKDA
jgi:hypothetical protein